MSSTEVGAGFRVHRTFHPTLRVPDLQVAENFYKRAFGATIIPSYMGDFSSCMLVRDVFFESIVPQRYLVDGVQRLASVDRPEVNGFGWYVDGVEEIFERCKRHGIRPVDQFEDPVQGDQLPEVASFKLFFTARDSTGLRYTLFPEMRLELDDRTAEGWSLGPVADDDPLGIVMSSHHTILTSRPERALRFVVEVLGGRVIHEGRNELVGATSTYVRLADAVMEYAVPDRGSAAYATWARSIPSDTFYSVSWIVQDLEKAERHLAAQGARVMARADGAFITDPETSIIPWGFSETAAPGDDRPFPA